MSDYYTEEAEYFRQKIEFEKAFEDTYGVTFDRIRELADAEKDGRVVVLPCKVTDLLYVIYSPKHPANPSDKGKWFMATAQVNRIKLGAKGFSIETWMGSFSESEIGKTVFFTQSEAERALSATEPKGEPHT